MLRFSVTKKRTVQFTLGSAPSKLQTCHLKRIAERTRERIVKGIAEIAEGIAEGIAKSLECLLAWKPEHGEVGSSKVRKVESSKVRNVQNGVRLGAAI